MPILDKVNMELKNKNISAEIIDLRSLSPLDVDTIALSVQKTGRILLLDTARKTGGVMAEVAASVQETSSDYLDGPVVRVGSEDVPWPYNRKLEQHAMANVKKIIKELEIGYSL
jgi:pyruvate dehydrogenase E1 component beta subunit